MKGRWAGGHGPRQARTKVVGRSTRRADVAPVSRARTDTTAKRAQAVAVPIQRDGAEMLYDQKGTMVHEPRRSGRRWPARGRAAVRAEPRRSTRRNKGVFVIATQGGIRAASRRHRRGAVSRGPHGLKSRRVTRARRVGASARRRRGGQDEKEKTLTRMNDSRAIFIALQVDLGNKLRSCMTAGNMWPYTM